MMSVETKTWSGLFPVHPAADVFPRMSDDELAALAADIKANGLQHSIVLWQDNADTHLKSSAPYYILDGRNRLAAMDRAGIPVPADPLGTGAAGAFEQLAGGRVFDRKCAYGWSGTLGSLGRGGKSAWTKTPEVDPAAFVIGANVHRRHLSKEQQADLIVKAVQASEEFLAKLARNREAEDSKAGRPSDPVKSKAVQEGVKQGIGKRTIERSLARQEGRPTAPRKPKLALAPTPVPRVEPLRAEATPSPTETYEEKLQAKMDKARLEVHKASEALKYWRGELHEAESVLANYRTKRAEASEEATAS